MKATATLARTRFQNILFATDFSPAAARAVPYVKKIAQHFQSNVLALHVHLPAMNPVTVPGTWPIDTEVLKAADQAHRKEILQSFAGIPTEVQIDDGDIQFCLSHAVQDREIDLVVIGTRGRTGLGKLLLGSVAEEIFRNVTCPVLTVGPHADGTRETKECFREILYATDFHPHAQAAAGYAVSLAQEFQARLLLLHVVPGRTPGDLGSWSSVNASLKELLRKLVPPEAEASCRPEYFVERGDPAQRILDLAKLRETDLIVLGAQREEGVPGAATHLSIATAHKVVSHATCPVLTVRH